MSETQSNTNQSKPKFYPLPDGLYNMTIMGAKRGTSKKGHEMVTVVMTPFESRYEGKKAFYNVLCDDQYRKYSRSFFDALGLNNIDIRSFDFFQLAGMRLRAVVKVEKKNGVLRQKFVKFLPFSETVKSLPIIPDLPPIDVPLADVLHFSRQTLIFRAFRYQGAKDNRKAFDRGRKLVSVLNYFLNWLKNSQGVGWDSSEQPEETKGE